MSNKANISWWDHQLPSLENWEKGRYSELNESDRAYLDGLKGKDTFYSELAGSTSASDLLIINAIAEQTHGRILQKYRIKDTLYWPWVVGVLSIVVFIVAMTFFSNRNEKKEKLNVHNKTSQVSQTGALSMVEYSSLSEPGEEKTKHLSQPVIDSNSDDNTSDNQLSHQHEVQDRDEDTQVKIMDASSEAMDMGAKEVSEAQENAGEKSDNDAEVKKEVTKKKKGYGERFVSKAGNHSAKSRDVSVPLKLSMVRVEQAANYAVYLNSKTKKSSTNDGQISGGESDAQTRVKFAPEDMPQYPGNNDRLESDLEYLIGKHALKKEYDEIVSVMVSFIIDAKGVMKDIKVHGYKTQEIKSSILKSLAELDPWKKGKKSGKKGSVRYEILISYK